MSRRLHNGTSVRENLEAAARQRAKRGQPPPPELVGPDLPAAGEHVWEWFADLSAARGSSGFGPAPITYSEIAAWAQLTGETPLPWEVKAIKALDAEFLLSASTDKPPPSTGGKQQTKQTEKGTPNAGHR